MKKVVIVGAGFGGLEAARKLLPLHRKGKIHLSVIDRKNHHLFQPLLYQVAMAGLSPAEIAVPIRSILGGKNAPEILMTEVKAVDLKNKKVLSHIGEHPYDYLVLACGARHSYFGNENWEPHAPGLKTLEQATEIRRRVLYAFENAERVTDPAEQKKWLTFVVVGGGPTGVELAGAIGEISRFTLAKDFKHIDPLKTRIVLVEAGPRILPSFSLETSRKASRDLESLGVQIWTESRVTQITAEKVSISGETIRSKTVLWAAGVQPSEINTTLEKVQLSKSGHLMVETDLSLKSYPEVFAVGDQVQFLDSEGNPLPGIAPVALQQGSTVAQNIIADLSERPRQDFRYLDKGQMATIGRKRAVVETAGLRFSGVIAWLIWLFIHIYFLIGFKNRAIVLFRWALLYFNYTRGARLIVEKNWQFYPKKTNPKKQNPK